MIRKSCLHKVVLPMPLPTVWLLSSNASQHHISRRSQQWKPVPCVGGHIDYIHTYIHWSFTITTRVFVAAVVITIVAAVDHHPVIFRLLNDTRMCLSISSDNGTRRFVVGVRHYVRHTHTQTHTCTFVSVYFIRSSSQETRSAIRIRHFTSRLIQQWSKVLPS